MLRAYWLRLLLFALVGAAVAAVISYLVPKKYEAVVEILIDQKPISPTISSASENPAVGDLVDFNRPRSLSTTVQMLVAYGVVKDAAERVARQNQLDANVGSHGPLDPVDLMQAISVGAEAQSDIISLKIRHTDSKLAADLAREIPNAFTKQNEDNTRALAQQAIFLLTQQLVPIKAKLAQVDAEVEQLRNDAKTGDVATSIQGTISLLNSHRTSRDMTAMELQAATARAGVLESELSGIEKRQNLGSNTGPNPVYQRYQGDLAVATARLEALRQRYTEGREEVQAARKEKLILMDLVKNTPKTISSSTDGINDNARTLRQSVAEARAGVSALRDRLTEAESRVSAVESELQKFIPIQTKILTASRTQESLQRLVLGYTEKVEALRAAGIGRLAPIREVTPAQALPEPVSPKVQINILFGIIGGLLLGVLSMLATEAKRQPVRSLAQLNALALRPVYRMVPELRQPYRGLSKAPAEAFESLLANYLRSTDRPYRIAIVGISKDAGASTAANNLAIAGARHGARVLMIQCDPRGGLSRMTAKQPPAQGEFIEISSLIKATTADSVLSLSPDRNPEIAADIRSHESDLTIIDLEPTTRSAEYAFLAPHVDEVILLVRAGRSKSVEFLQAQQALKESGCKTVTVAFTRASDLSVVSESVDTDTKGTPAGPSLPPSLDTDA